MPARGFPILIAPEGTRLDTTEVGPFKKGPFRIAMSAGIPIVPIVIRNAEVIAARDSSTFNPGTVDVVVYPPIPIDDWTHENLSDRIAEVRQLYLDTLKDWPHDEVPKTGAVHARRRRRRRRPPRRPGEEGRQEGAGQEGAAKKTTAKKATAKKTPKRRREGSAVKPPPTLARFTTTDDALVLASVSSPAEQELLDDWLQHQRREHPELQGRGAAASGRRTSRRPACWPGSSRNSRPTRTARWCRCGCSGCPVACPRAPRWSR